MGDLGGLEPDELLEVDITTPRAPLVCECPPLPPGALVLEARAGGAVDVVSIATLRLEGGELRAEGCPGGGKPNLGWCARWRSAVEPRRSK